MRSILLNFEINVCKVLCLWDAERHLFHRDTEKRYASPICLLTAVEFIEACKDMHKLTQAVRWRQSSRPLLGQKLSKLSLKDHCSRDPVQVQSRHMRRSKPILLNSINWWGVFLIKFNEWLANSGCDIHMSRSELLIVTCKSLARDTTQGSKDIVGTRVPQKLRDSHWCVPFTATFSKRRKIGALWSEHCDSARGGSWPIILNFENWKEVFGNYFWVKHFFSVCFSWNT